VAGELESNPMLHQQVTELRERLYQPVRK
jgi:hypothetical protein